MAPPSPEDTRYNVETLPPDLKTPAGYLFGAVGEVTSLVGSFSDPERQAFCTGPNTSIPKRPLYIITFLASALWADGQVKKDRLKQTKFLFENAHAGSRTST